MSTATPNKAATSSDDYRYEWTPHTGTSSYIQFNLGSSLPIGEVYLWQYGQAGPGGVAAGRAIQNATIWYATDPTGGDANHSEKSGASGWTQYNPNNFPWPNSTNTSTDHTVVDMTNIGITAQYWEIDPTTDYGGNDVHGGLAQILFYQAGGAPNLLPITTALTISANGTLDLNGGTQQVASLSGYGTLTTSSTTWPAAFTVNGGSSTTFYGQITDSSSSGAAGSLSLTMSGAGTLTLTGSNTYGGGTTISAGTLQIGNGGSGEYLASPSISNSGALVLNHADALTYAGSITGPGSLTKTGTGMLSLTGNSNYLGSTNVNGGTLAVNGQLWGSGNVAVNSGTVLSGSGIVGNLLVNSTGTLAPGYTAGAGTLQATTLTISSGGVLNYTLGAAAGGNGFVNVSQSQGVVASGVTLNVADGGGLALGTPYPLIGCISLPSNATSAFSTVNLPGSFTHDTATFAISGSVLDMTISAAPSVVAGVWQTGSGSWSIAGNWNNSGQVPGGHSGDTAVFGTLGASGGTVTLDSSQSVASLGFSNSGGASFTIVPAGASTLTLANTTGTATISNSGGSHTITAPIVLAANVNSLDVSASTGSALTIAGSLTATADTSLSVSGGGALILSGTDHYSGGTTVNASTLAVTSASALPSSGLIMIGGGGRLVLGGGSGIGALLAASSPISSDAVALSAAAALPAAIESPSGNMATLGGAPSLPQGGGGNAVGGSAAAVPEPGTLALLAAGVLALAAAAPRKRS